MAETESHPIGVKDAVRIALEHAADLFGREKIENLALEEVVPTDDGWDVTVGFSRPWDRTLPPPFGGPTKRDYKVVSVGEDGKVGAVKMRRVG